jgi:hypothetical protein
MNFAKAFILASILFQGAVNAQKLYVRPAFKMGTLTAPEYQYTMGFYNPIGGNRYTETIDANSPGNIAVSAGICLDLHLYELNKQMSLGIHTSPTFGLYFPLEARYYDDMGIPWLRSIPVYAQFNYGTFSTPEALVDRGIGLGLGMHYLALSNRNITEPVLDLVGASPLSWVMPSVRISYRYWNFFDTLTTINLVYSLSGTSDSGVRTDFRQQYIDISFNWQFRY